MIVYDKIGKQIIWATQLYPILQNFCIEKKPNNNKYSGKIKNTCIKTKDLCVFELFSFAY